MVNECCEGLVDLALVGFRDGGCGRCGWSLSEMRSWSYVFFNFSGSRGAMRIVSACKIEWN